MEKKYYTYVLKCKDESLYCGYTDNLIRRVQCHNDGKGAKYTRAHRPCELVYYEEYDTKSEAMSREYAIKHMTRKEKEQLIAGGEDVYDNIKRMYDSKK